MFFDSNLPKRLGWSNATSFTVIACAAGNVALVNFYTPTRTWKYVMWEGGILEWMTAVNFVMAATIYATLTLKSDAPKHRRVWFALFGFGCMILAGEELSWGQELSVLHLDRFNNPPSSYNIQGGNLHNVFDARLPTGLFLVIAIVLRCSARISLKMIPLPVGFLNAIIVTAMALLFMDFGTRYRFLVVDEVFEWSGSLLIFYLALYHKYGWFFR